MPPVPARKRTTWGRRGPSDNGTEEQNPKVEDPRKMDDPMIIYTTFHMNVLYMAFHMTGQTDLGNLVEIMNSADHPPAESASTYPRLALLRPFGDEGPSEDDQETNHKMTNAIDTVYAETLDDYAVNGSESLLWL